MLAKRTMTERSRQACRQSHKYKQSDDVTEHEIAFFVSSCAGAFIQIASAYLQWSFGKELCRGMVKQGEIDSP